MRKTRHIWAAGNEHIRVHRSGSSSGESIFTLLFWAGAVIFGLVLLYYIWDFVQILLILTMIGLVARCFFK